MRGLLLIISTLFITSCVQEGAGDEKQSADSIVVTNESPKKEIKDVVEAVYISIKDTHEPLDETYLPKTHSDVEPFGEIVLPSLILEPSQYHGEEITNEMLEAEWYHLRYADNVWVTEKAAVKFTRVEDPVVDEGTDKTGWDVSGKEGDILLAKVSGLKTMKVQSSERFPKRSLALGDTIEFNLNERSYKFYTTGQNVLDENMVQCTRNFKLYFEHEHTKQVLFACPFYGDNYDKTISIDFVGDINNDTEPDVIISEDAYNSGTIFLFLSDMNADTVRFAAHHNSIGC